MPRSLRTISCKICGKEFRSRWLTARFCSKSCVWKATKGADFNARISRETKEKRGELQRGRGEGKFYRKRSGRHEHRLVAEKKIGRALLAGEVVHHIDGNRLNNHPDNLAVMTQAEHIREHKPWEHWNERARSDV